MGNSHAAIQQSFQAFFYKVVSEFSLRQFRMKKTILQACHFKTLLHPAFLAKGFLLHKIQL